MGVPLFTAAAWAAICINILSLDGERPSFGFLSGRYRRYHNITSHPHFFLFHTQ